MADNAEDIRNEAQFVKMPDGEVSSGGCRLGKELNTENMLVRKSLEHYGSLNDAEHGKAPQLPR